MSDFGIESREERRRRYLRLARAATEAAAKTPLPAAKGMYVRLAKGWAALAGESAETGGLAHKAPADASQHHPLLHAKLKDNP